MAPGKKHVVFDIVGTCVSYDVMVDALDRRLGDRLRAELVKPQLLVNMWLEAAEREYTYLGITGRYRLFSDLLQGLFYRMLWSAGIQDPRSFASDDDLAYVLEHARALQIRPGVAECFRLLREAGFTVWAFTCDDAGKIGGYFRNSDIYLPDDNILSCDGSAIAKPVPEAYRLVRERFDDDDETWFAAAHMWDVSSAKTTGFKGAYCTVLEKEPCTDLFGEMDVIVDDFPSLARGIIKASSAA